MRACIDVLFESSYQINSMETSFGYIFWDHKEEVKGSTRYCGCKSKRFTKH